MWTKSHDHADRPQVNPLTCWSTLWQWCYAMFPEMAQDVMDIQNQKDKPKKKKKKTKTKTEKQNQKQNPKKKNNNNQNQNSDSGSFTIGLHSPDDPDFQGCRHPA